MTSFLKLNKSKAVVDVNIFVAGVAFKSLIAKKIIDQFCTSQFQLFYNQPFLDELIGKLIYFGLSQSERQVILLKLEKQAYFVESLVAIGHLKFQAKDSQDNYLLELAQTIKSDFLVTRDKDLLSINNSEPKKEDSFGTWDSTVILKPEPFLSAFGGD
jgi:putative PIN family toxin of toxin-antitoxin system